MASKGKIALGLLGGCVLISGIAGVSDLDTNTINSLNSTTNIPNTYSEQNIINNDTNDTLDNIVNEFENNTTIENSTNDTPETQPIVTTSTPIPTKVENIVSTPRPTDPPKSTQPSFPTQAPISTLEPTTPSNIGSSSNDETSQMVWVGETGTKYHYQFCRTLKGKGHSITLSQALAEGRQPCKVCH